MARRKDLAGLATLAGLAYMASRDKPAKGESAPMGDDQYNPDVKQRSPDLGAIYAEDGSLSKLRRNTETGDLYSPDEPITRAVAPKPAATRSVAAKAPSNPNYGNEGRRQIKEPSKLQYQSLQDRARAYEEERAASGAPGMYGTRKSVRREPLPTAEDMAYKKGGSVKGWGAARGARKAKIY